MDEGKIDLFQTKLGTIRGDVPGGKGHLVGGLGWGLLDAQGVHAGLHTDIHKAAYQGVYRLVSAAI
jgi:hypothetical protein